MKFLIVFAAVTITAVFGDSKLDKIDTDAILKSDRLLQNHFNCLVEGKGCTPEGEEMKKHIGELFETCCAACTEKHKEDGKKITKHLIENKPELLKKFLNKFDPDKKIREKCAEELNGSGIDLSDF